MARMLLIEDNPDDLDLMTYLLEAYGHTTVPASTGQAGLDAAQAERPDLVLCDLQLPDIDGFEVARQIRLSPALHNVPLLAVTAFAMVGDRQKVLAAGYDGYLTKPLNPDIFLKQVEGFLLPSPRSQPPETHAPVGEALRLQPQRAKILVVDDTSVNLDLMRNILEPSGFAVEVAQQVGAALALARRSAPDLIMSDLNMPVQDGRELVQAVKADPQLNFIPVILYSAEGGSPSDKAEAYSLGVDRFLALPVEPPVLVAVVEACLRATSGPPGFENPWRLETPQAWPPA